MTWGHRIKIATQRRRIARNEPGSFDTRFTPGTERAERVEPVNLAPLIAAVLLAAAFFSFQGTVVTGSVTAQGAPATDGGVPPTGGS
jgi:hypothetical protein